MALDHLQPANDNGSRPGGRTSTAPGLAIRGRDEQGRQDHPEGGREAAKERDRQVHPALDALDRRRIDADALGELRLTPFPSDPQLADS